VRKEMNTQMERQKVEAEKIRKELNEEIAKISTEFEKKS